MPLKKQWGYTALPKVFAGIGENMVGGLSVGFMDGFGTVERKIAGAVSKLAGDASVNVGVSGGVTGQKGVANKGFAGWQYNGSTITATGKADAIAIGQSAEQGVLRALRAAGAA